MAIGLYFDGFERSPLSGTNTTNTSIYLKIAVYSYKTSGTNLIQNQTIACDMYAVLKFKINTAKYLRFNIPLFHSSFWI